MTNAIILSNEEKQLLIVRYKVSSLKKLNEELDILAEIQIVDMQFADRCYSKASKIANYWNENQAQIAQKAKA